MYDETFLDFVTEFDELLDIYKSGVKQIVTFLEIMNVEFKHTQNHKPIESIQYRIKSSKSIKKKLIKKNLSFDMNSITKLKDIAGIRIICPFISDVYNLAQIICMQDNIELITMKDYIERPKPNGYRSLHLIVKNNIQLANQTKMVIVEIQIRTVGMDSWASLEHQLCYKNSHKITQDILDELRYCADEIADFDIRMQKIANRLSRNQIGMNNVFDNKI